MDENGADLIKSFDGETTTAVTKFLFASNLALYLKCNIDVFTSTLQH